MRVVVVSPEPTPYRSPLFDRVAELPGVELTVLYASPAPAGRGWAVEPRHDARFLSGRRVPGTSWALRHDYLVNPGLRSALGRARPDVVVVSGWSTFAAQASIVWCLLHRVPYVLLVESHDEGPRSGWRRVVKDAVVPRFVRRAAGVLAVGSLARASMITRGAPPGRVGIFANTIDVEEYGRRADELRSRRPEIRTGLGLRVDEIVVVTVARLAPEKGLETLVEAAAEAVPPVALVVVGDGPERESLEQLARRRDVRAIFTGSLPWERVGAAYVAADVFALLSSRETWGVVVNEAAACGLPLVLSDRVGAAADLLHDGENGYLVPAGDAAATARRLGELAADATLRDRFGARSREIVAGWGYEPSVASFADVVLAAARDARQGGTSQGGSGS
jgi:glycosyltransferase involved in cell wall biosynthesis